jgi:hypothetical protein
MQDVRWSPDIPAQKIYPLGRVVDDETGEAFVVVRRFEPIPGKRRCPAWALPEADWDRLVPIIASDRDGAA